MPCAPSRRARRHDRDGQGYDDADEFEVGLELILDALEVRLAASRDLDD